MTQIVGACNRSALSKLSGKYFRIVGNIGGKGALKTLSVILKDDFWGMDSIFADYFLQ
jgi:hypothetical protein